MHLKERIRRLEREVFRDREAKGFQWPELAFYIWMNREYPDKARMPGFMLDLYRTSKAKVREPAGQQPTQPEPIGANATETNHGKESPPVGQTS